MNGQKNAHATGGNNARGSHSGSNFTIICDSREQYPYRFDRIRQRVDGADVPIHVSTVVEALPTGDYSLVGFADRIAVERKASVDELAICCGVDRERFEHELQRLSEMDSAHLVLEFTFLDVFQADTISRISRRSVCGSLIAWSERFNVKVWFLGSRRAGEFMTYELLRRFHEDETKAARELQRLQRAAARLQPPGLLPAGAIAVG
jgi:ERCC4-type nuclease